MLRTLAVSMLLAAVAATAARAAAPDTTALGKLEADAVALRPLVRTSLARGFLDATRELPHVTPRVVWRDSSRTHAWTDAEAEALPDSARARLIRRELDETFYWNTRYGSPLAYVRTLEILASHGFTEVRGKRIADF